MSLAPQALTMDRLDEKDDLILAQSTSMCCRCCCFQPSINWVLAEGSNYEPGKDPFSLDSTGWIHEESSFCGRSWSWIFAGARAIKYVQHYGPPPPSLMNADNKGWFNCQTGNVTNGLEQSEINENAVAIHEKDCTCTHCFVFGDIKIPICNFFPLPYLETKNAEDGAVLGHTIYVCDHCLFVPKYDVYDGNNEKKFRIRPDTCVAGCCVQCRCGEGKGKCFRVPFIIRDPMTLEPLDTESSNLDTNGAQVDVLWSGWNNECCTKKNAYHLAFPRNATPEEKLLLTGAALLVDVTNFEQPEDQ